MSNTHNSPQTFAELSEFFSVRLKIGHTPKIPQIIIISSRETGDENPSKNQDCLVSHFFRYQTQSPYCCLHIPFNPTIYIYIDIGVY